MASESIAGGHAPPSGAVQREHAPPFSRQPLPHGVARWLPGVAVLRAYDRAWLLKDIIAGLVLTAVLIPVGMGYAEAAGLPPVHGLYATIVPLTIYALFGPSRILVLGPDSSLAAIIAAAVLPLAGANAAAVAPLAALLAVLTGLLCLLGGVAGLGFVTDLLSKPIRYGYLNGIALTVLVGQLPKLLGFSVEGSGLYQEVRGLVQGIMAEQTNLIAFAIGVACLVVILGCKRWAPKLPGVLVAVVGATIVSAWLDLAARAGLAVVGPLPAGLPSFQLPPLSPAAIGALLPGALAITLVSFADTSVLSRSFALRGGYKVDQNQEMVALGAANVAAGLFQGFSISSSASRTPVAESAGAKTQVTGLVGALCIALLLVFFPTLLQDLPSAALGAVVIAACLSLVEIPGVARLWRLRRGEFAVSVLCFLGVAFAGVVPGIFLSVGVALLAFIWRAWRPYDAVLGRVDGLKGYHDVTRYPQAQRIPGLVLFRWDAPLFFANGEIFREHVQDAVASAPTPTAWVVVAAEPVTDVDVTAADALVALDEDLAGAGIELCFAEMKDPVKDQLQRYGILTRFGAHRFFPTVGEAVDRYVVEHEVEWVDWEDGPQYEREDGR
jgi:high affinity sulfate transporter 1